MTYVTGSLQFLSGVVGVIQSTSPSLEVAFASLPLTGQTSFSFDARLDNAVPTQVLITNTGEVLWTSLSGTIV